MIRPAATSPAVPSPAVPSPAASSPAAPSPAATSPAATRPATSGHGAERSPVLAPPAPAARVTLVLDLPDASLADAVEVAETLHSLALDLAPRAEARTDVHPAGVAAPR